MDWLDYLILPSVQSHTLDRGILSLKLPERYGINLHKEMHGSHLRNLQNQKFKLSYYESKFYKQILKKWLEPLDRSKPVMDVGAGDGRFTELLLDIGFEKIIATDICLDSLYSLAVFLEERGCRDKVRLIHCDIVDTPIKKEALSAIICIGVLYYLNEDYEKGKKYIVTMLQKDGLLIESEPDLEGQALKALVFDNTDIFANVIDSHRFVEVYEGRSYKLRLFDRNEMKRFFEECGLVVVDWHGLSLFPLMMVCALANRLARIENIDKYHSDIEKNFDYFDQNGNIYKHIIWLGRKH